MGGGGLFKRGACLTLWPSKWVLIWGGGRGGGLCFLQRGRLFAKLLVELGQWVLTHSLWFFKKNWQSNPALRLGMWAQFEPPPPRGFKQPILKSSNAHGLPGGVLNLRIDRRIKSWQSRCDTVMNVHTDFRPFQLTTRFSRPMSYHQYKCAGMATYDFKKISLPRSPLKIERLQVSNHQMRCPLPRDTVN